MPRLQLETETHLHGRSTENTPPYKNKEPDTLISSKKYNLLAIAIVFGRDFTDPTPARAQETGKMAERSESGWIRHLGEDFCLGRSISSPST